MRGRRFNRITTQFNDFFHSLPFKQRILISFVILITLAISAAGTISYLIASKEIQNNAFESSQETVNKTAQIMDTRLKNISTSIQSLMFSDAFEQMLRDVQNNDFLNYYKHLSALQFVFSQISYNEPLIQNVLIATPIGDFYSTSENRNPAQSFYDSDLYDKIKNSPKGVWYKGHADLFFSGNQRVLSFVTKGMHERVSSDPLNVFVVVNIKEREFVRLINQKSPSKDRNYVLVDAKGEDVIQDDIPNTYQFNQDALFLQQMRSGLQGSFFHEFHNADYLVNYTKLEIADDWVLIGTQSKDLLLQQVNGIKRTTLYIIVGFVLTSWLLSNYLTALLLRPLFKLQGLMRKVEDNQLSVRFESRYTDEVAQVGFQFNRMLDEINQLIGNVKFSEQEKRKAEIKALTAQMEPHFLYNTLNAIYCKSVLGENNDVNELILALSQMFQLGLSGGKDMMTLEDELSHVKQYCAIQQKCYEGLFEYELIVEDDQLLAYYVPKIVLQPLVENSILHGFKDKASEGRIRIQISEDDQMLHLLVEDNGTGIDMDKVKQGMAAGGNTKKGYALRNIRNRLQLYYGNESRMKLTNNDKNGTTVALWIPMNKGDHE
ncbi:sensor histidine kinase [Paenibacillus sp. FSL H7-0331]|uniref:cache domain-containing sensor histidine kinase n=1 Tax=Paenibacillus sp. FSL H7-0331 TaxID=1920421 RepID=UPI00096F0866|nr:sensor histidine kinase [Paenibacillus sp. FSL H7-0331]OMF11639.1 two-component sensor histidine kinase [Paenibacillus sp. FSL H7-0331]